ncbi:MAG: TonB-dependent receptor plug domain-containing protein [Opitutaceae bacterium]|nr:TonB-dependent receptor plug domain-containing protein [Opitutaceae bacterium]
MPTNLRLPLCILASAAIAALPFTATADDASTPPVQLPSFRVEAEAEADHFVQGPFLPDIQGTKVNIGKKTTILDFDSLPRINGNNYRQALAEAPGLVLSEETTPLLSIGYRGLNPGRVQFMQVLVDGVPIHADQFGYPEAYYSPPLDTVDRIEFTRGGAALMYGPQPGGSLNYITHRPRTDRPFSGETMHSFGSDNAYATFNYVDGTVGRFGYYGYYHHRETDGFRSANSDVKLDGYYGRVAIDAMSASRWLFTAESFQEEHGEAGGLTFATGPGRVNFNTERDTASRLYDRFNLRRRAAAVIWERDLANGTFATRAWAIDYTRASKRQNGGGFGTLPTGAAANTNSIERQQFNTYGAEGRLRLDWGPTNRHVFTAGTQVFTTRSPRTDARGNTADADNGDVQSRSLRESFYAPVFVENLFRFGSLSVTPGVRFENVREKVTEHFNLAKQNAGTPLGGAHDRQNLPLFGLAVAYDLPVKTQTYLNVSQSYRPIIFTQAVPTGGTAVVPADLQESRASNYELGVRSQPARGLVLDASLFYLDFDNQIGSVSLPGGRSSVGNVGRSVHRGVEASVHYNLFSLFGATSRHELNVYANAMLLRARFESGPQMGRTPQFAPEHLIRTGLVYSLGETTKVSLLGTFVDRVFGDDNNSAERAIPAYSVWDLTAETKIPGTRFRVIGGTNNLLDENYYSRVTNAGIDPAPRRNYYVGASFEF